MKKEIHKGYKDKEKRKKYLLKYNRIWREKNREKIRKYMRKYMRENYRKNREKRIAYQREYNKNHYTYIAKDSNEMIGNCKKGREYELKALKFLNGSIDINGNSFHNSYDIYWQGKRIDVKSREIKKDNTWSFKTTKTCKADYFLCFCLIKNTIIKILLIPEKKYRNGISVGNGKKSKWDVYSILTKKVNSKEV